MANLILYYSRKGASFGRGIAIHGADAAESESRFASWAEQETK